MSQLMKFQTMCTWNEFNMQTWFWIRIFMEAIPNAVILSVPVVLYLVLKCEWFHWRLA